MTEVMAAIQCKTPDELALMREAGRIVAEALQIVRSMAQPGVSTLALDRAADEFIEKKGAVAAFKGYRGFPACLCTSFNDEVVHGIPGERQLREGDLLKVDCGAVWKGYFGDAAITVPIGQVSKTAAKLLAVTRDSLYAGIAAARAGVRVSDISRAVQQEVQRHGFAVVTEYTGHGIGRKMHEDPQVPNFVMNGAGGRRDPVLEAGATLAIEPMVNVGGQRTRLLGDGWTVVTRDGSLSAHFEHTIAIEDGGAAVLTAP
jgi:methionyl aminopeptidase